jgi:hypothetical protein
MAWATEGYASNERINTGDTGSPFVPFTGDVPLATMPLNKLSGEGLFDERPSTQTSLGRFVLDLKRAKPVEG